MYSWHPNLLATVHGSIFRVTFDSVFLPYVPCLIYQQIPNCSTCQVHPYVIITLYLHYCQTGLVCYHLPLHHCSSLQMPLWVLLLSLKIHLLGRGGGLELWPRNIAQHIDFCLPTPLVVPVSLNIKIKATGWLGRSLALHCPWLQSLLFPVFFLFCKTIFPAPRHQLLSWYLGICCRW